jgi:hypothetical protein
LHPFRFNRSGARRTLHQNGRNKLQFWHQYVYRIRTKMIQEGNIMRASSSAVLPWPVDSETKWIMPAAGLPRVALLVPPGSSARMWGDLASSAGLAPVLTLSHGTLPHRLDEVTTLDAVVIDLRGAADWAETGQSRHLVDLLADQRSVCGLVIVDLAGLEPALALLDGLADFEWLCTPDAVELAGGLAILTHRVRQSRVAPRVREDFGEAESGRLEALSAEMRRLTEVIERLTAVSPGGRRDGLIQDRNRDFGVAAGDAFQDTALLAGRRNSTVPLTPQALHTVLRARRLRDRFFAGDLFADPGWDIILDLMVARLAGERVSVSSLCIAAAVPPTTALRWIRQLTDRAVVRRIDDAADGRRVFIELSDETARAVEAWWVAATDKHAHGLAGV